MSSDRPYTTPPHPVADSIIAGHMEHICRAILACSGIRIQSIALTGGFGRGEGGVAIEGSGTIRPVNDYDILVVTRGDSPLWFVRTLRHVKSTEPALSLACGVRVDIACKTPAMLRGSPPTVDSYEMAVGCRLLWGSDAPMQNIPWRCAKSLPRAEATRYLFNRGAALLWARRMLEQQPAPPEEIWQFVLIAVQKARLAWGDALLLMETQYTASYVERQRRLKMCDVPGRLAFAPSLYAEALQFKLQPDFQRYRGVVLLRLLLETIGQHEQVWRWIEEQRGLAAPIPGDFWREYLQTAGTRLRCSEWQPSWGRRLYCTALNLRTLGVRAIAPSLKRSFPKAPWLIEHPEERLVRVLPLLLFREPGSELPYERLSVLLGMPRTAADGDPHQALSDRLLALWHPGKPYYGAMLS